MLIVAHPKNKAKAEAIQLITSWTCTEELFPRVIELVTLGKTFVLFCNTDEEQKQWVDAFNDAISELVNKQAGMKELRENYVIKKRQGMWKVISATAPDTADENSDEEEEQVVAINPLLTLRAEGSGIVRPAHTGSSAKQRLMRTTSSAAVSGH